MAALWEGDRYGAGDNGCDKVVFHIFGFAVLFKDELPPNSSA
jgi:hypothetical protein